MVESQEWNAPMQWQLDCKSPYKRLQRTVSYLHDRFYVFSTNRNDSYYFRNRANYLKNCKCAVGRCQISIYQTDVQYKKDFTNLHYSAIFLYYKTNLIRNVEELIGYDWNNFLSDIGGSLGFLLGMYALRFLQDELFCCHI